MDDRRCRHPLRRRVRVRASSRGADFGAGFWDLVAGGAERGARPRALVDHSIGPVWEANHVWLIFCPRRALDRVPRSLRVDHAHALRPAHARRARHRAAWLELRVPQERCRDSRSGAHSYGALRGLVGSRALLHGRGRGRDRLGSCPGRRQGRRPVVELDQPDVDPGWCACGRRSCAYLASIYLVCGRAPARARTRWSSTSGGARVVAGDRRGSRRVGRHLRPQRRRGIRVRRPDLTRPPARDPVGVVRHRLARPAPTPVTSRRARARGRGSG